MSEYFYPCGCPLWLNTIEVRDRFGNKAFGHSFHTILDGVEGETGYYCRGEYLKCGSVEPEEDLAQT